MADGFRQKKPYRTSLPAQQSTKKEANLFAILKNCIGKDLSNITMPVEFNEPLSFLQRISEYMEYSDLLRKANDAEDPLERLEYVAAFAVSALASNWERMNKPFNPLLGETYELNREDLSLNLVCEQVCHHPPMSAFHAESDHCYRFYGNIQPKLKFWGKSLEIKPEGTLNVELIKHKEVYSWSNVNCCVHNIIIGKLWFEQYGLMEIHCHTNGYVAQLNFKQAGWFCKDLHRVEGMIIDSQKKKLRFLYGKWTNYLKSSSVENYEEYAKDRSSNGKHRQNSVSTADGMYSTTADDILGSSGRRKMVSKMNVFTRSLTAGSASTTIGRSPSPEPLMPTHDSSDGIEDCDVPKSDSSASLHIPNSNCLWKVAQRPRDSAKYYNFTAFALALNDMSDDASKLPSTDCRFRPDIRHLEEGDTEAAPQEKSRLEEKQRDARKQRKKRKETWQPNWFDLTKLPHLKNDIWVFNRRYWLREFSDCPDIF